MVSTTPAVSSAPAVTTLSAVTSTPPVRRTPTKAALKSYDAALARPASPVRDPLNPDLKADSLGGDPYVDLFGEDSDGDDIPCGQQQNMERLLQLAEELGSQGHTLQLEKDLLAPPITAPAPQPQPAPGQPPVFDIAALVAALKEATPPLPPPQPEVPQSLLAITQSLAASQRLDAPVALRSPSPSPSRYSPPLSKRPHRREESVPPARTRSEQSSPASSPGQFSDQSEDEEEEHHAEEEAFDPCGIPPVEARSALHHELLGTSPDNPTDPVDVPVVSTPPQTASTSTAPSRLGPLRDGSSDHTVPPHPDLTRSWRESWEAPWNLFRLFMHCRKC